MTLTTTVSEVYRDHQQRHSKKYLSDFGQLTWISALICLLEMASFAGIPKRCFSLY